MPDLAWNGAFWNGLYDWNTGGEEWSKYWGGSEAQWFGSIYPRLHRFLPAKSVLEIAPGFGRWTKFLIPASSSYIGVDLSQECIDACGRIFTEGSISTPVSFMKNDGLSLTNVQEASCDIIFSFDSLVHCDMEIIQSYIPEILRVLKPGGVAFIHHSNLLAFGNSIGQPHARSLTVSADTVASSIEGAGGSTLIQEVINWGGEHMHDCLTLFGRYRVGTELVRIENPQFMVEALSIRDFQAPWSRQASRS
ncbi:class I SAM-dependent methyltransferase [Nitrosospira sp. Nsp13]|uniref:class I SAM-dependent methyltransferase n=1 Tax=Nitrosospira sp. Nsp13 TaxID=1855332 RepID=UPI000892252E|nr:class I SAM-dependent methyltransferase [Nitrosospira sp. Nsp13]SCY43879.1 Methyltransferase domain-containing protein [Nitrosospira sp. Nsp13]